MSELELGITTLFLILSEEDIPAYYLHGLVEMQVLFGPEVTTEQDLMQYACGTLPSNIAFDDFLPSF